MLQCGDGLSAVRHGSRLNLILLRETGVKQLLIKFCFTGVSRNKIITTTSTVLSVLTSRIHDSVGRDKTEETWLDPHSGNCSLTLPRELFTPPRELFRESLDRITLAAVVNPYSGKSSAFDKLARKSGDRDENVSSSWNYTERR